MKFRAFFYLLCFIASPLLAYHYRLPIIRGRPLPPPVKSEKVFNISAYYANDLIGNPSGGAHHGFANAGSFGVNWSLDFEKLVNWKGFSLINSLVYRSGRNLSAQRIHNQFPVQQLYGSETYKLVELYLKESLFNERLVIKLGRLSNGNDFLNSPYYLRYVTNSICGNPISIFFNTPFQAYPNTEWGAYLGFKPVSNFLMKWAIYGTNQRIQKNKYHGANFTFQNPQGAFLITEWDYILNQGPDDKGLPGDYKIAGYAVTGKKAEYSGQTAPNNWGYYFLFDQMVYRKGDQTSTDGLIAWGAFLMAPANRNEFPFFAATGFIARGLIANGRHDDALCLGVTYGHYSSDLRNAELFAQRNGLIGPFGNHAQTAETNLELNYWYHVNKWVDLTPVAQYIINPKGFGTIRNAFTLGMQILITLQ